MSARTLVAVAFVALAVAACDDDVQPTSPTAPSVRKAPAAAALVAQIKPGAKQSSVCKALIRAQVSVQANAATKPVNPGLLRAQVDKYKAAQADVCN